MGSLPNVTRLADALAHPTRRQPGTIPVPAKAGIVPQLYVKEIARRLLAAFAHKKTPRFLRKRLQCELRIAPLRQAQTPTQGVALPPPTAHLPLALLELCSQARRRSSAICSSRRASMSRLPLATGAKWRFCLQMHAEGPFSAAKLRFCLAAHAIGAFGRPSKAELVDTCLLSTTPHYVFFTRICSKRSLLVCKSGRTDVLRQKMAL